MSESNNGHPDQSPLAKYAKHIDHVAVAVHDLEAAITSYKQMGFILSEQRETLGDSSKMSSAVMTAGPLKFVLLQGDAGDSQISQFIREYGPGPQHIALAVDNCALVCAELEREGIAFSTSVIESDGLTQRFTARCANTGVMFEFIERAEGQEGFSQGNVEGLFKELESKNLY